jgi:hypothetical protein
MEKPKGPTLLDVAEALATLIERVDLFETKMESDLASVGENIVSSIFRLAEALQTRVSELERSDSNLKHRLAMLEERLTELEKRLNLQPPGQRLQ